jgi:hypothetical protein
MTTQETKGNELTLEEIKSAVDKACLEFWAKNLEDSKTMFPDQPRAQWIYRGRIYQSLFANHFIKGHQDVAIALHKQEIEEHKEQLNKGSEDGKT